jgi:hypothetical protein
VSPLLLQDVYRSPGSAERHSNNGDAYDLARCDLEPCDGRRFVAVVRAARRAAAHQLPDTA